MSGQCYKQRRRTVNVCVQHFNLYKLSKSNLTNANILVSGSVQFQPEQISAVTDSDPEQRQPDHMITITVLSLDNHY